MLTYAVYADDGQELCAGLGTYGAGCMAAQFYANHLQAPVWLDTVPSSANPEDDEDCGEVFEPQVEE